MDSFAIARYLPNGELDESFGQGGKLVVSFDDDAELPSTMSVMIGRNDRIIVCGDLGPAKVGIVKITADGVITADSKIIRPFMEGEASPVIRKILIAKNDPIIEPGISTPDVAGPEVPLPFEPRIFVTGEVGISSSSKQAAIACFDLQGELDPGFGGDGQLVVDFEFPQMQLKAIAASQRDNKIIIAANAVISPTSSTLGILLARILSNGTLDPGFGNNGTMLVLFALEGEPSSLRIDVQDAVIQSDHILIVGSGQIQGQNIKQFCVASVNDIGANAGFGNRGVALASFSSDLSKANSVIIDARARIIAAGESDNHFALARFLRTGRPDISFSRDGRLTTEFGESFSEALVIKMDSPITERIVVAGTAGSQFALARYLNNGSIDNSFGSNGKLRTVIVNENVFTTVLDLAFDSQNRIIAVGSLDTEFFA
jgi:uncharacterized delta-60 repeat protein